MKHSKSIYLRRELTNTEKGCTEPLLGKKAKCVLRIVPLDDPSPPFSINPKCVPKTITRFEFTDTH